MLPRTGRNHWTRSLSSAEPGVVARLHQAMPVVTYADMVHLCVEKTLVAKNV